jgi:3-oxoacyl-[acyl-carrier-protein] synthase II
MGAAGAAEAIVSIKSISDGIIPGTINTKNVDPELPSNMNIIFGDSIEADVNVVMSNTFGFGGHNGIVVFKKL